MARRLTSFFTGSTASSSGSTHTGVSNSGQHDNDTASVTSEYSGSAATFESPNEKRRSGIGGLIFGSINDSYYDADIDESIRNLYQDPDILEKKCQLSIKGTKYPEMERIISKPTSSESNGIDEAHGKESSSNSLERSLDEIPSEFFDEDFDPLKKFILEVSSMDPFTYNEYFMSMILQVDSDKDVVMGQLSTMIEASYNDLMNCMHNVHDIDIDITRATITIFDSRTRIKNASQILSNGPVKIAQASKNIEKLSVVRDAIHSLKYVKDLYRAMKLDITTGDLGRAAQYMSYILEAIKDDEYYCFQALSSIADSTRKGIKKIRQKADKALQRLSCRKFASTEYHNIIRAYLTLDHLALNYGEDISLPQSEDSAFFDSLGCMEGLSLRIQHYQMEDIDSCLHTAVLEFIYAIQHKKQKVAAELDFSGSFSAINASEMMDLAELPIYMLYQRITPEMVAPSIIRACELFAESIFTHFLIMQWHTSFVSFVPTTEESRAQGLTFLINSDNNNTVGTMIISSEAEFETLKTAHEKIKMNRNTLWKDLMRGLIEMVNSVNIPATVPLDDFIAISWAMRTMSRLGIEFCSADCEPLFLCLEGKCAEYVQNYHTESFLIYRQLMDADPWENVPIKVSEYGGIIGILKSKLTTSRSQHSLIRLVIKAEENGLNETASMNSPSDISASSSFRTTEESVVEEDNHLHRSIFSLFQSKGNPFHFMTEDDNGLDGLTTTSSDVNDTKDGTKQRRMDEDIANFMSRFFEDINPNKDRSSTTANSKRKQQLNDTLVVTQSAVNGLSKYTGRYLQCMHMIPSAAADIWKNLCELYDFHLCYIFNGFITNDEKQKFLGKYTKMNIPAPDQFNDFEALSQYLEKQLSGDTNAQQSTQTLTHRDTESAMTGSSTHESDQGNNSSSNSLLNNITSMDSKHNFSAIFAESVAHVSNSDLETFYSINKRIVAAESCWFAAKVLLEIKTKLQEMLPVDYDMICEPFISNYQIISSQLRSLIYKSICPLLIKQTWILSQIENVSWDSKKLKDSHHDWVDKTVLACKEVWDYINIGNSFSDATPVVREQIWLELCQSTFDTFLEGFSKIRKCTNEGRALMTMDVAALYDGLDNIHACRPPRGREHLDNFIQATYLSDDNTMTWAQENFHSYSYRQIHGLLTLNLSSVLNPRRLRDALQVLDNLYLAESTNGNLRSLSVIFDPKSKEEGRMLTRIMTNRLMRASIVSSNDGR